MGPYGGLAQDPPREYLEEGQCNNGDNEPAKNLSTPFGNSINAFDERPNLFTRDLRFRKLPEGITAFRELLWKTTTFH